MSEDKTAASPVITRPFGVPASNEEERQGLDRMAARADEMERLCRKLVKEARLAYVRDKSDIEERFRVELAQLEVFHVKRMADLEHSLRRIEALRSA